MFQGPRNSECTGSKMSVDDTFVSAAMTRIVEQVKNVRKSRHTDISGSKNINRLFRLILIYCLIHLSCSAQLEIVMNLFFTEDVHG